MSFRHPGFLLQFDLNFQNVESASKYQVMSIFIITRDRIRICDALCCKIHFTSNFGKVAHTDHKNKSSSTMPIQDSDALNLRYVMIIQLLEFCLLNYDKNR